MSFTELDHLVVVADTLSQGEQWCRAVLGVVPQAGGAHAQMGTHNLLLSVGGGVYLEIIAVDPSAAAPAHRRWFDMDSPGSINRAREEPYLAAFVARTNDLDAAVQVMPQLGVVRHMRRGDLQWKIAVTEDGSLLDHGTTPILIEWAAGQHPTQKLVPSPCQLLRLEVRTTDAQRLRAAWMPLGLDASDLLVPVMDDGIDGGGKVLRAVFDTPRGIRAI